jgi:hypothetical protein
MAKVYAGLTALKQHQHTPGARFPYYSVIPHQLGRVEREEMMHRVLIPGFLTEGNV